MLFFFSTAFNFCVHFPIICENYNQIKKNLTIHNEYNDNNNNDYKNDNIYNNNSSNNNNNNNNNSNNDYDNELQAV